MTFVHTNMPNGKPTEKCQPSPTLRKDTQTHTCMRTHARTCTRTLLTHVQVKNMNNIRHQSTLINSITYIMSVVHVVT